ncbi:tyrosine-type recombinase/integrase [Agrobacterium rubi]|uniref:tyrosine-type recombinase/integrase n=1 Tax=Agrobacterium rubi TaxID=28099 RepID=UPI001573879C|nr:integrase arm-type DNA-binding domain-containing protein [Agrobacterium rubi]NTF06371.1 tyrosine-type recombinase/integrase [Agrobacterium rubi]NTF18612.1 tyrosine-type recombinase/integrase [Agrobacterium rubi]NTF25576.1 tyrosine-type recombinase/integrase [Agrobacterium rubi]
MKLTDIQVKNVKADSKPRKLSDGRGLYLFISVAGGKSWRFDYDFFGKRKTLTIGAYPQVGLSDARRLRDEAKKKLSEDLDPSLAKKRDQLAAKATAGNTFGVIADEFIDKLKRDKRADPTITKNKWMLNELAKKLRPYPITQITAKDILVVLTSIEKSGRVESALATRATIGRVFRYAIATARAENDPTSALRGALQRHVPVSHAALTSKAELGGLMRAIYGYEGWPSLVAALKIQALCFARPGETRSMEWIEVNIENAVWTIPAQKAKMRREHHIPLSRQAIEIIKLMMEFYGDGPYVFPSMMSGKKLLSENSMNSALRRMGVTGDEHTAHGFRSSASSILNESGEFKPDAIEAQLAHVDGSTVRRIYNRATYWDERVRMMQWWADLLDTARAANTGV